MVIQRINFLNARQKQPLLQFFFNQPPGLLIAEFIQTFHECNFPAFFIAKADEAVGLTPRKAFGHEQHNFLEATVVIRNFSGQMAGFVAIEL